MNKINRVFSKFTGSDINAASTILFVVLGTELFHFVNSIKLNLIMPTIANVLNESRVRSWRISNGNICIHYGKFLWDTLSVIVFMALCLAIWKLLNKYFAKK